MFICSECGYGSVSWYGKCPSCGAWNSLKQQEVQTSSSGKSSKATPAKFTPFSKILGHDTRRMKTGLFEVDRVLGGGFVTGQAILLAGEPGVGKSTLLLKSLKDMRVVYVSGEESAQQIRQRADRLGLKLSGFSISDSAEIESVLAALESETKSFDVVVVDSIQTVHSKRLPSGLGSMSQIREVAQVLIDFAKRTNKVLIIIGHITKEGEIAGPKSLEHLVDCVCYLEGDKLSHYRILRVHKNRFGTTDEVGVFEMGEKGLSELKDSTVFVDNLTEAAVGKVIVGTAEGSRTFFFEVQSLVVSTTLTMPRRVVSGVDYNKVQLLLAVLRKKLHVPLDKFDIFINVVGGVSIKSTAADLGVVASVYSSVKNIPVNPKAVFIGEIGLLGEVRPVFSQEKIIKEARRYGFSKIYTSKNVSSISSLPSLLK